MNMKSVKIGNKQLSVPIIQALINAVNGDLDHGLIFCGSRVGEIQKISTVHEVIQELVI